MKINALKIRKTSDIQWISIKKNDGHFCDHVWQFSIHSIHYTILYMKKFILDSLLCVQKYYGPNQRDVTVWTNLKMLRLIKWQNVWKDQYSLLWLMKVQLEITIRRIQHMIVSMHVKQVSKSMFDWNASPFYIVRVGKMPNDFDCDGIIHSEGEHKWALCNVLYYTHTMIYMKFQFYLFRWTLILLLFAVSLCIHTDFIMQNQNEVYIWKCGAYFCYRLAWACNIFIICTFVENVHDFPRFHEIWKKKWTWKFFPSKYEI